MEGENNKMISMNEIYKLIAEIPAYDVHTHLDASHLSARGLHDIMLYHMVISDLYSAGCPNGARLSEEPSENEIEFRIEQALPYLKYIENTSCYWGMRIILKELYEWEQPITADNWRIIHGIIKTKSENKEWSRIILKRAGICRAGTELWRGHKGIADDVLAYSLEWAFFTRAQWGQFDTALLELENAWGQDEPGAPLPVTLDVSSLGITKHISSIENVNEAIKHYCDKIPYDNILSIASHLSTDIEYRVVTEEEMKKALENRANAGEKERDIYSNYIFEKFLFEFENTNMDIVLQFSIGAEPLPYETGSKLRSETVFELAQILHRHPKIKFQIFLSNEHQNQALCTLARELPNLSLSGYWWHNFFPSSIRKVMNERLDMVAANKQIGFFSDAYCVDWAYAKSNIVRKQLAQVLLGKVEQGQYTINQALNVARQILHDSPELLLKMKA